MNLDAEQALENATMRLFASLDWDTVNAFYEAFTPEQATPSRPYLGRRDETEVILRPRLRQALGTLNPDLPPAAIEAAIAELARGRGLMTPVRANREVYRLLKNGVRVVYRDDEDREPTDARLRQIEDEMVAQALGLSLDELAEREGKDRKRVGLAHRRRTPVEVAQDEMVASALGREVG